VISATSAVNGNESYLYDGDGRRVRKTWTPNGGAAQVTAMSTDSTDSLPPNTRIKSVRPRYGLAVYRFARQCSRGHREKPQAGSAVVTECYDYLPFGRILSSSDNGRNTACYPSNPDYALTSAESQKFTGKVRDVETGLDFFGARYFSAALGRFTGPDTLFADQRPSDPQSWNMYAYVGNNPLRFVDVNGKWRTEIHRAIIDGAFVGLTDAQRDVLKAASIKVDGFLNGGQSSPNAYMHGMRGNLQSADEAGNWRTPLYRRMRPEPGHLPASMEALRVQP